MILCLDVGNTQIFGGVFNDKELIFKFRYTSEKTSSSDQIGIFLKNVLSENKIDPNDIAKIAICSVVPQSVYSIRSACIKYFGIQAFILEAGVKTGLKIKYKNPSEVGADRISNAVAAKTAYPDTNLIIADFGTATTFCAISKNAEYLGGVILPGLRLSMEALESKTAKLPSVEIIRTQDLVGRTTVESIQSGLYYGHLFSVMGIIQKIKEEKFKNENCLVIGTGGFSVLYENTGVFDQIDSDLVLRGLQESHQLNV
ncbi:MAG: type III pantothenate kinase [Bdellovibrionales bacterium]